LTWTYDPALLKDVTVGTLMQLRLELSDTDDAEHLLEDEEIVFITSAESGFWNAAARLAEIIARKFARQADQVDSAVVKLSFKKRVDQYAQMAKDLRKRASAQNAPRVVATSQSAKDSALSNPDRSGPYFRVGMLNSDSYDPANRCR
jgi:hypothetical protein